MTELPISDITRMDRRFCVLGLQRDSNGFSSIRPIPPNTTGWRPFPYGRGDRIVFDLDVVPVTRPHFEDRRTARHRKLGAVTEIELVQFLKQAEVAPSVTGMFGCCLRAGGSGLYVNPDNATRSICGCEISAVRFRFYAEKVRAALALRSGDTLEDLPVVDRDWCEFADNLKNRIRVQPEAPARLQELFESIVEQQVTSSPIRFARIGLSRPFRGRRCWLMLDSLFPLPKSAWLAEFT
jgi:hypothetical protein